MHRLRAEDGGEGLPAEFFRRILAGESAVRIWREHRRLAPDALAERAGISHDTLAGLEAGSASGSVETLLAIARELNVPLDELV